MKTLQTLALCIVGLLILTSCAHESRSPSSEESKEASKKFYEVRSASFKN